jgi:signal transduction histidine kinase
VTVTAAARPSTAAHRAGSNAGWLVGGLTTVLLVGALVLDVRTGSYQQLLYLAIGGALTCLGVLLTTRMPEHPISWGFAATGFLWAVGSYAYAYAIEALVAHPGSLPGGRVAAWVDNWCWLPSLVLPMSLLLLVAPDGRLLSARWRLAVVAVVGGTALASAGLSGSPTFELGSAEPVENPLALDPAVWHLAAVVGFTLVSGAVIASLLSFVLRFRRSLGEERQQLRWVGGSLGLGVGLGAIGAFTWGVFPYAYVLYSIALLALPVGTAVAVLKYRLYELDLVVNRAFVYGAMTFAVVASYVLVVGLVGATLSHRGNLALSLVLTGVVAVCFQPVRERVQRFVNERMYGERDDPYAALARLGRRLESSLGADSVLTTAVETIGQTLRLKYVALALAGSDDIAAAYGIPGNDPFEVPLAHQGKAVGVLRFSPRAGEQLRDADRRLIADLAPQVAAAAHAVGLAQDLQAARRRLVELREDERRRIRRDLHDGLGPALAGLTFTLDAVSNLAGTDLERANALLGSATEQVQAMIGEIRRLIYDLRPPALDELGLVDSLRGIASRQTPPATTVTVDTPDALPPLPAAVEVAAYRIVQEALTNVARHADAQFCSVRLSVQPDALLVEISDDGQGIDGHRIGVGLHAMQERAAELGGICRITSARGRGTIVAARLPRFAPDREAAG